MTVPTVRAQAYRPRVIDAVIRDRLTSSGAVLLEGPKACGKTFTAEQHAASALYLDLNAQARAAIQVDPSLALEGQPPQLVDEWQLEATTVWNHVRDRANRAGPGQFILTGSAVPDDDADRHTGAGRFARLRMRPMSLFESGESTGVMSLSDLLAGNRPTSPETALTITRVLETVVRGGWPMNLELEVEAAATANRDYLRSIAEVDIARVDPARRDPERARRLLMALARNVAMEHSVTRLTAEADAADGGLARSTTYDYLNAFERLMVIEQQPAWVTHLRSRARLRSKARTHFIDPSLAVAALSTGVDGLRRDLNAFGYLFESLVVRDMRVYADRLEGTVFHYRDSDELEVDIVVQAGGGWGAFEVKLGNAQIDEAAAKLLAFAAKVDTSTVGDPGVLAVVTATGFGYTREDGVVVIPIGALGP